VFTSQAGADDSYIAANFLNADFAGNISNWLLTPVLTLDEGVVLSFFTRTQLNPPAADNLEVRLSTNGASTNVGATDASVGDFTTLLFSVNPALAPSGYPSDWFQVTVPLSGLGGPTTGSFALRYAVPDTSVNGDYIGIDTLTVSNAEIIPEPSTAVMFLVGGVAGGVMFRRRVSRTFPALATLLAVSIPSVFGQSADSANVAKEGKAAKTELQPGRAKTVPPGAVAVKDQATGQIRQPGASEIGTVANTGPSTSRAVVFTMADKPVMQEFRGPGTAVGIRLDDSFMSSVVATRGADGKLTMACVPGNGANAAAQPSKTAAPKAAPHEPKAAPHEE